MVTKQNSPGAFFLPANTQPSLWLGRASITPAHQKPQEYSHAKGDANGMIRVLPDGLIGSFGTFDSRGLDRAPGFLALVNGRSQTPAGLNHLLFCHMGGRG